MLSAMQTQFLLMSQMILAASIPALAQPQPAKAKEATSVVPSPRLAQRVMVGRMPSLVVVQPILDQRVLNAKIDASRKITVTQSQARFLSFRENIVSIWAQDNVVIDARAMNARTVAVTGKAVGRARLAILSPRLPNGSDGKPEIFEVEVKPLLPSAPSTTSSALVQGGFVWLQPNHILQVLGNPELKADEDFETMLISEIQKRDARIKELEKRLTAK